ncbi:hypothetical protein F4X33_03645 [Candidatus Poribacteria bacterium]|nr:hypothetical protein [Candidatus Poribacteria bacterium]
MQRRYNPAHCILVSVIALGLTSLVVGVDAQAQIAFTSDREGNSEIYVMDTDGQNPQRLTDDPAVDHSPSWSPDGKRIAFVSDREGDEDIYVMDIDGGNRRKLTQHRRGDGSPSWSPDGKRIAFAYVGRDGKADIYVMDADGQNPRQLTNNPLAFDYEPAWYRPVFAVAPVGKQFTTWGWLKQGPR